jgi:transposase-like protein
MKVFSDLKSRGCQDILIAVTDGLKGMSEALAAVYPATTLQTGIVHLLRNSLEYANWKQRTPSRPPCGRSIRRRARMRR